MHHSDFVHLHVHSQYSLLDGACSLEKLVAKAKEYRMPALAVTDHGNLFGAIDFYTLAMKEGVKPIIGCEVYIAPGSRFERSNQDSGYEGASHITLLAKDQVGYKNLIKLVSAGYLEGFYYKPRIDRELFAQHCQGLIVLSGCLNSEAAKALLNGDEARARETVSWYTEALGRENYFLEIQDHGMAEQKKVAEGILRLAKAFELPIVATNDLHYPSKEDARAHEVLLCIQTGKTIQDKDRWRFSTDQFYFKSAAEMKQVFVELPEAVKNTITVAERCNLQLQFGQLRLPKYQAPEGYTIETYLAHLAWEGLKVRYPDVNAEVETRMKYELEVIQKTGFAGYFLVVWDFIKYAKDRGISVGPGRGSAAASLVAYCLGITNIDPLRYGLIFERFLNPERISMPDMDIDFSDDRRDEVIEYVTRKYGADNVAQIITFGTMGAKAVIRDVGRGLGMPYSEVDKIAKLVPNRINISLDEAIAESPPLTEAVQSRAEVEELWRIAKCLEGLTRHASTHAAGVVISGDPLTEHVPLYKDSKAGSKPTTQYAMKGIETIGLLKIDFLGLRTLTVIANTLELIAAGRGHRFKIEEIPLDDPAIFQLLSEARTFGVFQLESSGMRDLMRRLKPERLEDVIAIVALYRPGPMVMIDDFIDRKHGKVKIRYDHPLMETILKETYGIMVYQEQVMRIASDLAGFSMGEADVLRKAMGKKDPEMMDQQRKKFVDGAKAKKIPARTAEKVFDKMAPFAGYAFNKPHATAYAIVAYQTAYLKAHYPVEFMAALLTSGMADTDKIAKYIDECRQMGITVLPPDVNESESSFTVVGEQIRFGLVAIKNVGETAIQSILATRRGKGPLRSIFDFCERVDLRLVNKRVIESLIKCGAFDSLGAARAQLMAVADKAMEAGAGVQRERVHGQVSMLDVLETKGGLGHQAGALPVIPEWSASLRLAAEKETLGFYVTGHPLAAYRDVIAKVAAVTTDRLATCQDKETVTLCAIVVAIKEIATKNGERMAFVTLEDMVGTVEAVVFPELYKANLLHLVKDVAVLVKGQVDVGEEVVKLLLTEVSPLANARRNGRSIVEITVEESHLSAPQLEQLKGLLLRFPGPVPVKLHLSVAPGAQVTIAASPDMTVAADELLRREVEALLGPGTITGA
ncbi:DNA polymerase III subunit alpha [Candidatus Methylomirabilis limnetica]|uniref:DNA polymerase III subunit alpha n=1 Tax=Candidatus Methylomirabilis limnetica TaxID=2033718 RepID=A0A2T4TVH4_9BACT|nr:DNA polymerase III subunit alpha [Candidatus Methylomirabilis limnetica]PTL35078.1 DNA polymerase III subunit alpha [Candidatus Methylomirabilis limnetica]